MRRIIVFTLLGLTMFGGVAAADSYRHRGRDYRGGVHVQRSYPRHTARPYNRPVYRQRHVYRQPRHVYRPSYRYNRPTYRYSRPAYRYNSGYRYNVVRRPIYVQRPVVARRYYNYYQRPSLIVENYAPMTGYYWVPGQWQWDGYEWIWQPGHYEPDPAYDAYPYAPTYPYYGY